MSFRNVAYKTLALSNDMRAIRRGRVGKRIVRRILGRLSGRAIGRLTR